MSMNFEPTPVGMTPPIDADFIPEPRSAWPTVIGVISIILGALGTLTYGCCGTIGTLAGPMFMGMANPDHVPAVTKAQMTVTQAYAVPAVAFNLLMAGLAVTLLFAGIGLIRRKRSTGKLHKVWAIARIIVAVPQNVFSYVMNNAMWEAMQKAAADSGDPMPPGLGTIMGSMGIITVVFGLAWAAAWPVFVLIWFSRAKIRSEVSAWEDRVRI